MLTGSYRLYATLPGGSWSPANALTIEPRSRDLPTSAPLDAPTTKCHPLRLSEWEEVTRLARTNHRDRRTSWALGWGFGKEVFASLSLFPYV